MPNLEIYSNQAIPLANAAGEAETQAKLEAQEQILAKQEAKLQEAGTKPEQLKARLRELNACQGPRYAEQKRALLDEAVLGDPPLDEFSRRYATIAAQQDFTGRAIQYLVVWLQPAAEREILVCELAVSQARLSVLETKTLLAMVRRHRLIAPLIQHERTLEVTGGLAEALAEQALEARREVTRLKELLREFDEQISVMQMKYSLS